MSRLAAALACACLALAAHTVFAATQADAGRLPLAYRVTEGAYPWTGRLFALGWQAPANGATAAVPPSFLWEASEPLDRRSVASRRIFTSSSPTDEPPEHAIPLQWEGIDDFFRHRGAEDDPLHAGKESFDWLRGDRTRADLRPRDTRLGGATGARVRVVAPPAWSPGKPGHSGFRVRYGLRRHMAWLGTNDGLLHAFDAVTGDERAAYLPRALLPHAIAMAAPDAPLVPAPCPRPEAQDVMIRGDWRTVLLCGVPAGAQAGNPAAAFALDVSDPESPTPIALLWEIMASDTLPLSARGPVRAAGIAGQSGLRWHAVVTLAATTNDKSAPTRSALALLPLDKPAGTPWAGDYAVRRLALPERDCLGRPATGELVAVSVLSDMSGTARAAYATDDAGQLWRFSLDPAPLPGNAPSVSCMHRLKGQGQPLVDEAPVLLGSAVAPVVVYGAGNELAAIPDATLAQGSAPLPVATQASGDGHILRAPPGAAADSGWHLTLPNPGERIMQIESVFPGYLLFVSQTPDGARRAYLVLAATGESVVRAPNGERLLAATGHLLAPDASVFVTATPLPAEPAQPGRPSRQAYELSLWAVAGNAVTRLAQTQASRRTGRLRWREIVGPVREALP